MPDLEKLGFKQDEFGEFRAADCTVVIYQGEIDVYLPNGQSFSLDGASLGIRPKGSSKPPAGGRFFPTRIT